MVADWIRSFISIYPSRAPALPAEHPLANFKLYFYFKPKIYTNQSYMSGIPISFVCRPRNRLTAAFAQLEAEKRVHRSRRVEQERFGCEFVKRNRRNHFCSQPAIVADGTEPSHDGGPVDIA